MKNQKRDIRIIVYVLVVIFALLDLIIHFESLWVEENVGVVSIDEVIFHLKVPMEGTSNDLIFSNITSCLIPSIIIFSILLFLLFFNFKYYSVIYLKLKNKEFQIKTKKLLVYALLIFELLFLIYKFNYVNEKFGIAEYLKSQLEQSSFIEDNYVDPNDVKITFPKNKKNLIYIYLESMESTYSHATVDGEKDYNLIPRLTTLAEENTNFSDTSSIGGAYQVHGSTFTIAAMVGHTAGVPLKIPINGNSYTGYNQFLPGITNLGDILEKNGYNQTIIVGSDADFGGRKTYFKTHGNYKVKDLYTARKDGIIPEDHYVFWGYEDSYLFEYAKKQLSELSSKEEPFNLTLLTVNTHFPTGYVEDDCEGISDTNKYANSIYCSQEQAYSFIEWVKEQDFYNNTTIIVVGDHLTMANNEIINGDRRLYNAFINTGKDPVNNKNRKFTNFDMFPTTLASIGAEIEGNRLGLGVNLYSGEETIIEKYGNEKVTKELSKKSNFYDSFIYKN